MSQESGLSLERLVAGWWGNGKLGPGDLIVVRQGSECLGGEVVMVVPPYWTPVSEIAEQLNIFSRRVNTIFDGVGLDVDVYKRAVGGCDVGMFYVEFSRLASS